MTWHWACDCSFRCFHEIGRYFDNKEQERAKTRARRPDRSQRRQERPKIDSFWGANTGFIDFQHYATLCSGNRKNDVTASSGTAISTDFATLTCSEILSKILIRCVTWHWACDCSFRCFHEIGRYFDNKEQERAKTRARRHDRSQRRQERPKIDSFWGANTGFIDFQHYATLCSGNRKNESFRLKILVWCLEPLRPSFLAVWFAIFVPVFMYFQWFWLYSVALALV